jgi:hypothetical protein
LWECLEKLGAPGRRSFLHAWPNNPADTQRDKLKYLLFLKEFHQ